MKTGVPVIIGAVVVGEVILAAVAILRGWRPDEIVGLVSGLLLVTVPQIVQALATRQVAANHKETVAQVRQVADALRGAGVDVPPAGSPTIS